MFEEFDQIISDFLFQAEIFIHNEKGKQSHHG